ncbi:probable aspartic proteinase GIP2 [Tanacetum coccineum]
MTNGGGGVASLTFEQHKFATKIDAQLDMDERPRCRSAQCSLAMSTACATECPGTPKPECNNNTCLLMHDSSVTRVATIGDLGSDVVTIQSTDGKNPGRVVFSSAILVYLWFYESININQKVVPVNKTLLSINREGYGGTKISTVNPYTVLHTSIYKAIIKAFGKSLSAAPRVSSVAPFGLCFNSTSLGSTRLGPGVPQIDLILQNKNVWTIFGANSMVQVSDDGLCLGVVDGGVDVMTSIVIGGHQIEDNLLQFDLGRSRLGFSLLIFGRQTTCANFNFTLNV